MKLKWKSFGNHFRRAGALLSTLLMICCMTVPALASNNWPASPSINDFFNHPNCWYVWQSSTLEGLPGYELICSPMTESGTSNTVGLSFPFAYSTNSGTYSITYSSGTVKTFMYATPYIPASISGSWQNFPSFPVGDASPYCAAVRIYPDISYGYLSNVSDVFTDRSVFGFLTSWPSSGVSSLSDKYDNEIIDAYPIYVPTNIFFFGDKSATSSGNVSGFGIAGGDNDFWATPSNHNYLHLSDSHYSTPGYRSFPAGVYISSSDIGFVFAKQPAGNNMHPYNTEFNVSLKFAATLWVPTTLLPDNVKVGDWISKASLEDLQDQLVNDFDVNSDTLKNSKQNFDSWQNSNTIDTDVANTGLDIINALMQNVGQFAFIVSLLCFGAVVLRVLIRKAVEG